MLFSLEILNYFFILPTSYFHHMLQGQFVQYRANIFQEDTLGFCDVDAVKISKIGQEIGVLWLKKYRQHFFEYPYFRVQSGTNGLKHLCPFPPPINKKVREKIR